MASHWHHRPTSRSFPVTPEYASCPYRSGSSNSTYHNQSLLPLLNEHLNVRLKNQGFGIWDLITDAGDDSGHGFPIDEERSVREIIDHENLEINYHGERIETTTAIQRVLGMASSWNFCEPLFIGKPNLSASISFKRKGLSRTDFVQAPPLEGGNIFQLNDLSDLNASGPGIGRLRPSLKYQKNSDKIVDYSAPFIGVIVGSNGINKSKFKDTVYKKLMGNFNIEVFFCDNPEHVKYLKKQFDVTVSSEKATTRELEVFVRKPIWGNPVGKKLVYLKLGGNIAQEFELIANNMQVRTSEDGRETVSFPHANAIFSSSYRVPIKIGFGNSSLEQPWTTLQMLRFS